MTLFDRLGGEGAISAVVDKFYEYMLADPVVNHFFANTNMTNQKNKQKQFITMVTGGPNNYGGLGMGAAHAKYKIEKAHFDATWNNLAKTLEFFAVGEAEKA